MLSPTLLFVWIIVQEFWYIAVAVIGAVVAVVASAHAVMYKRDTRATIAWVGLIYLVPLLGATLYVLLGINRIRRRGQALRTDVRPGSVPVDSHCPSVCEALAVDRYAALDRLVQKLTDRPLTDGNRITPLINGDEAYPAMLAAIDRAEQSVALCSYIFDNDEVGHRFLDALQNADRRGVEIRVLVDDVGSRYTRPTMVRLLRSAKIPVSNFLPTRVPRLFHYANLRNHRKILVVDGRIGFTGGTNIRAGHQLDLSPKHPAQCLHFQIDGPVVTHLQEVFTVDWAFATGETLAGDTWFPKLSAIGDVGARGIPDGPDEDFEKLSLTIEGAVSLAAERIVVVTPYFLPDSSLVTALNIAAMRGVDVDIVLPVKNNIALVQWATTAMLWQLIERGCRIWYAPQPFDHTKLLLVDDVWSLIGSTNWDPRSLRLNFEFNVECYCRALNAELSRIVQKKLSESRPVTLAEVDGRSVPIRLRDGAARLFSPFL